MKIRSSKLFFKGFTVVETLTAVVVSIVTITGLAMAASYAYQLNNFQNQKSTAQDIVRDVVSWEVKNTAFKEINIFDVDHDNYQDPDNNKDGYTVTLYESSDGPITDKAQYTRIESDLKAKFINPVIKMTTIPVFDASGKHDNHKVNVKVKLSWGNSDNKKVEYDTVVTDSDLTLSQRAVFPILQTESSGTCVPGNTGEPCCTTGAACSAGLDCDPDTNTCKVADSCGDISQACCSDSTCLPGNVCNEFNRCEKADQCGLVDNVCCDGGICTNSICNTSLNKCEITLSCGNQSNVCCKEGSPCNGGLTCWESSCQDCVAPLKLAKNKNKCCSGRILSGICQF